MKFNPLHLAAFFLMILASLAPASVLYVNVNNPSPAAPFTTWATAATNIQDAINATSNGDTVLVTNGVYAYGGAVVAGDLTNRVALTDVITVQSVNGPWVTTIAGAGASNGTAAVRCAWLTNGAALIGFTVIGGATRTTGDTSGGGIWCVSSNATVANCLIVSNTASMNGDAVYQGTVTGSLIENNMGAIASGGASYKSMLKNCTIVSNNAYGAVNPVTMTNCIIYYNASVDVVSSGSPISHCCSRSLLVGPGNFSSAPLLFADGVHLAIGSPCIGAGANPVSGTDVFGNAWSNPPAVGCAEWTAMTLVTTPQTTFFGNPVGFSIGNVAISSPPPYSFAWLKDGSPLQDNGHFSSTQSSNLVATGVSYNDAGNYQLVVSNASGITTSAVDQVVIHYVNAAGTNPVAPYLSWATAATNLQDAVDIASANEIVLATNGVYGAGGRSMDGIITNRVAINKAMLIQSINGPATSIIQGFWNPSVSNGPSALRCVWMTNGAILNGFTIRGGATRPESSFPNQSMNGGGIWGSSRSAVVNNCIITSNLAGYDGGGAYGVTLDYCTLAGNQAIGTGMSGSSIAGDAIGGGADNCNLTGCRVVGNFANQHGGGAANGTFTNCAFAGNLAFLDGSGFYQGTAFNCTISANTNSSGFSSYGGAAAGSTLTNCIVYGNITLGLKLGAVNYSSCTFGYCDTDPLPSGSGNIDIDPQLLADHIHLSATSPCIGAGTNVVNSFDIDGQPWNNPPPIGCDEWNPTAIVIVQPNFQIDPSARVLTFSTAAAGQAPFTYIWSKDGVTLQDNGHYLNSGTSNLMVTHFGLADAGSYQVVVTNSSNASTGAVAQVVIRAVDAAGLNPLSPYSSWQNAATSIQDAINAANAGDIIVVTNGLYATGGMVMTGDLTNRVAVNKAVTVMSVNGYRYTTIQGCSYPVVSNGPNAVRCVWLSDGAILSGFTIQNGATRTSSESGIDESLESGGGIYYPSTNYNGRVYNCVLTNNTAVYGGGMAAGTLKNSLVVSNFASYGGGTYGVNLNNCTVVNNFSPSGSQNRGAGTYFGLILNSIVTGNFDADTSGNYIADDNHGVFPGKSTYSYSCTSPLTQTQLSGTNNINSNPEFLDWFHISSVSPCCSAGNPAYATGVDLDDEPWNTTPSMGCDEVIVSNLTGPLAASFSIGWTNVPVNHTNFFWGQISGHASRATWSFSDGPIATNFGASSNHSWTNTGDYLISFTVYNNDNPAGITTNSIVHIVPLIVPQIQSPTVSTNGFQFQFSEQMDVLYTVQFTTNLTPPVTWSTWQNIFANTQGVIQIVDPASTNPARFYQVLAQ